MEDLVNSSNEKAIIGLLKEFGLPSNGSKAYLSLLRSSPATGYEISTQSGIPRSAIYSVLNRLESVGIINSIGDNPKRYIPLSTSSLMEHFSHLNTHRLQGLKKAFDSLEIDDEAFDFWHIHGYRNLTIKMREVIANAKNKIFLSAWAKEIEVVETELDDAAARGVEVTLFSFCKLNREIGTVVSYNINQSDLESVWNPKTILVADQEITLMGSAQYSVDSRSIWTKNKAITEIAINHIILDITLAGQRLGFDPNTIVTRLMKRQYSELDELLAKSRPLDQG